MEMGIPPPWRIQSAIPGAVWPALPEPGRAAVLALLHQLEDSQWLLPAQLAAQQYRQLEILLRHAYETVPYYRSRWRAAPSPAQLREIPILTRRDLQEHFAELTSERAPASHLPVTELRTSGSTGVPARVLRSALCGLLWNAMTLRDHLWHGRDLRGKLAAIKEIISPGPADNWGGATAGLVATGPATGMRAVTEIGSLFDWLRREDPDYLLAFPSVVAEFARASLEKGVRLSRLRQVRTLNEPLDPAVRELCRRAWGVKVTDVYSSAEAGYIALQCPEHEHYHVQSEGVLVEVLRDDDSACDPGERGRVVITVLHSHPMPLIRYEIGDHAEVGDPCACGRGLPVLRRILGRTRNMLVTVDGKRFWPELGLRSFLDIAPVRLNCRKIPATRKRPGSSQSATRIMTAAPRSGP